MASRGDPRFPLYRLLTRFECVPAQAWKARQLPTGPNVLSDDHQEPAIEILKVNSVIPDPGRPHTLRTQNMTWQLRLQIDLRSRVRRQVY